MAQERALKLVNIEHRVGAGDMPNIPTEIREYMGVEAQLRDGTGSCETASQCQRRARSMVPSAELRSRRSASTEPWSRAVAVCSSNPSGYRRSDRLSSEAVCR